MDSTVAHLTYLGVVIAFSSAVAVGCYVTKSAWPLWAFLLLPTFKYHPNECGCNINTEQVIEERVKDNEST